MAAHTGDCRSPNALLHFSRYASCPNLYHALFFNRYINSVTANLEIRQSDAKLHFDTSFPPLKKTKIKRGSYNLPVSELKRFASTFSANAIERPPVLSAVTATLKRKSDARPERRSATPRSLARPALWRHLREITFATMVIAMAFWPCLVAGEPPVKGRSLTFAEHFQAVKC